MTWLLLIVVAVKSCRTMGSLANAAMRAKWSCYHCHSRVLFSHPAGNKLRFSGPKARRAIGFENAHQHPRDKEKSVARNSKADAAGIFRAGGRAEVTAASF